MNGGWWRRCSPRVVAYLSGGDVQTVLTHARPHARTGEKLFYDWFGVYRKNVAPPDHIHIYSRVFAVRCRNAEMKYDSDERAPIHSNRMCVWIYSTKRNRKKCNQNARYAPGCRTNGNHNSIGIANVISPACDRHKWCLLCYCVRVLIARPVMM